MHHCCPASAFKHRYISTLLLSLNSMLHLEMPHINVLSKVDLVRQYGKLGKYQRSCVSRRAGLWASVGQQARHPAPQSGRP